MLIQGNEKERVGNKRLDLTNDETGGCNEWKKSFMKNKWLIFLKLVLTLYNMAWIWDTKSVCINF